jgi:hypothetical protein
MGAQSEILLLIRSALSEYSGNKNYTARLLFGFHSSDDYESRWVDGTKIRHDYRLAGRIAN